jgi:hypothetical protein
MILAVVENLLNPEIYIIANYLEVAVVVLQ